MDQNQTNVLRVKTALENGLKLTSLTAVSICQTVDLRKYISMLRDRGMDIKDEWKHSNNKKFKLYWLHKE